MTIFATPTPPRGGADLAISVDALRRIIRELRVLARKSELRAGLSAAQSFVLTTLAAQPGMSIGEVAEATMTDRSSVAAIIDRLVELKLVSRTQSREDRRRAEIAITPAGRRVLRRSAPPPTVVLMDAIGALSHADRHHLATGLEALARKMGIGHQPAGMLFEDAVPPLRRRVKHG
jgi:DNA-binding MarR family transcriptional regulator